MPEEYKKLSKEVFDKQLKIDEWKSMSLVLAILNIVLFILLIITFFYV